MELGEVQQVVVAVVIEVETLAAGIQSTVGAAHTGFKEIENRG